MLVIQVSLPCCVYADGPVTLRLKGGTDVAFAPPPHHTIHSLLPILRTMGMDVTMDVVRRGFYPKGGGEIVCATRPLTRPLRPVVLTDAGRSWSVSVYSAVWGDHLVERVGEKCKEYKKALRSIFGDRWYVNHCNQRES